MRRPLLLLMLALALAGSTSGSGAAPTPIVVELFTSEGCSDCPAADRLLSRLVATQPIAGARVIGLGQHVDYWDRLGWKDRFSSAALTNRQQIYGARFNTESIYTPQMIVDGAAEFVGSDEAAARSAIAKALGAPHGVVTLEVADGASDRQLRVEVTVRELPKTARGDHADILVAITEDGLGSDVKSGENRGRKLVHAAVVRSLQAIGEAGEGATSTARGELTLGAGWRREAIAIVAFVQERRGRQILASAAAPLQNVRR